jgi:hypothetical protein
VLFLQQAKSYALTSGCWPGSRILAGVSRLGVCHDSLDPFRQVFLSSRESETLYETSGRARSSPRILEKEKCICL